MGLVPKYYLFTGYRSQASIFFLRKITTINNIHYLSSKLSLTYRFNVNYQQIVLIPIYSVCVQGIPWQLSKEISNLFFQMSAQVYSVPDQTAGTRKPFLEWKCPVLFLTYRGNVSYYKIVHHPFPTCWNTEHPGTFQNKSLSSPIN